MTIIKDVQFCLYILQKAMLYMRNCVYCMHGYREFQDFKI